MASLSAHNSRSNSRTHTPVGSRPGTPSRLARNPADEYIKASALPQHPPNNLNLLDPSSQSRTNDLLGARNTEPIDDPPTDEEIARVAALAEKLSGKKK